MFSEDFEDAHITVSGRCPVSIEKFAGKYFLVNPQTMNVVRHPYSGKAFFGETLEEATRLARTLDYSIIEVID